MRYVVHTAAVLTAGIVLAACGSGAPANASGDAGGQSPAESIAASVAPSFDAVAVDRTRNELRAKVGSLTRLVSEVKDDLEMYQDWDRKELCVDPNGCDFADSMVASGEELVDWVEELRAWLEEAVRSDCMFESLTAFEAAIDGIEATSDRLFESPGGWGAAAVRALAKLDRVASDAQKADEALPSDCGSG